MGTHQSISTCPTYHSGLTRKRLSKMTNLFLGSTLKVVSHQPLQPVVHLFTFHTLWKIIVNDISKPVGLRPPRQRKSRRAPNVALVDSHAKSDRRANLAKVYRPFDGGENGNNNSLRRHPPRPPLQSPIPSASCSTFSSYFPPSPESSTASVFAMSNDAPDPSVIWPSVQSLSTKVIRELVAHFPFSAIDDARRRAATSSMQGVDELQDLFHQRGALWCRLVSHLTNTPTIDGEKKE